MKATILTILSVILLGATTTFAREVSSSDTIPTASGAIECAVYADQQGLVTFRMVKPAGEVVKVGIYNEKGNLMASRRYKNLTNIKLRFDLSECPEGLYQVRVKSGDEIVFTHNVPYPERFLAGK